MRTQSPLFATATARLVSVSFLALIFGLLAISVLDESRFARERIGVSLGEHGDGLQVDWVEPGLPAERAGLEQGDIILVDGDRYNDQLEALDRAINAGFGEAASLTILRDGQRMSVELMPGAPLDIGKLLAQLVMVLAYVGLALLAASYRHDDVRARLLMVFVGLISIELAMPAGHTLPEHWVWMMLIFWLLTTGAQVALELHLVSLIPTRLPLIARHPWIIRFYYALGAMTGLGLAGMLAWQSYDTELEPPRLLANAESLVLVGWAVSVSSILIWQIIRATSARGRNQALLVLIGLVPWAFYILASSFWSGWDQLGTTWTQTIENLSLLAFPAAVFVAIFRYGLLDIENLVRRSLVYGVVSALVLIVLYTLLTAALPWFTTTLGEAPGLWLITALAVAIGILFRPLRQHIEQVVERGLFPERRALRKRLIEVTAKLAQQGNLTDLLERLARETREALGLRWVVILAIEGRARKRHLTHSLGIETASAAALGRHLNPDSPVFTTLAQRQRPLSITRLGRHHANHADAMRKAGAEMLIPLFLQRRLVGLICLSTKSSGELFAREEVELLDLFSHQVATRLENLRLFQDATYEGLTGLLRRETILEQLDNECALARTNGTPLCLAMIDLDHFKAVNDKYGHLFGDQILEQVAVAMGGQIRAIDALGRFGGEEFLLVMPDTTIHGGLASADKLRRAIADLKFTTPDGQGHVQITASIGLTCLAPGKQAESARDLLDWADKAVYQAKANGRNQIEIGKPASDRFAF